MTGGKMIGISVLLVLVVGPLLLGLQGMLRARRAPRDASPALASAWNWKPMILSALLYTLAFNLTFFIQELFLVLPKALVPGLRPTLFHNNHNWQGSSALANLFQGTGVLAIFLSGAFCAWLLRRERHLSVTARLFLFWMAYSGLFMALPQVVFGAVSAQSDLGMAMVYLDLGTTTKTIMALAALVAIPTIALWMRYPLLNLAGDAADIGSARARNVFVFKMATLPSLIAIALIVPFRIPREWIEVLIIPVVVTLLGIAWIQAGVWRVDNAQSRNDSSTGSIAWPLAATLLLLLAFQLVLRPGIRFY